MPRGWAQHLGTDPVPTKSTRMNRIVKLTSIILLGGFIAFHFASAQIINPPQENFIQNQPLREEDSQPQTSPQETPFLTEEETPPPALSQEASQEIPNGENATIQKSAGQWSFTSSVAYVTVATVVLLVFFRFRWWRRWLKRRKKTELPSEAEDVKPPTEAEKSKKKAEQSPAEAEKLVCPTCGGTGKITKHRTKTVPCNHCKQTGVDICHHCSGTGRNGLGYGVPLEDIENYPKCDYCAGKGFPEIPSPCEFCKGKRTIEFQEPYEEPCPTCKGSGWIRNW